MGKSAKSVSWAWRSVSLPWIKAHLPLKLRMSGISEEREERRSVDTAIGSFSGSFMAEKRRRVDCEGSHFTLHTFEF